MSEELKVNIIEEVIQVNVEGWEYKEDTLPATTAENDVIVGSATIGTWVKKTLAQFKTILGLGSAAYTASTDYLPANTVIADEKVKFDSGDPTAGYLLDKIVAGEGMLITEGGGSNENKAVFALGEHNYIQFDTTPTLPTLVQGMEYWDSVNRCLNTYLGNNVTLQNGQELFFMGKATEAIANRDVVQIAGVQGDHFTIKKAVSAEIIATPQKLLGMATENIANGDYGYITFFGKINDVYTTGWSVNDLLYFDYVTGGLTNVLPTTYPIILLGKVIKLATGASENGILMAMPPLIYPKLSDLTDDSTHRTVTDTEKSTWNGKQDALVSGTNIKTINLGSILGSGDISLQTTLVSGTSIKTINLTSLLGSGDIPLIPYSGGTTNVDLGVHNLTVDTNTLFVDSVNHRVGFGTLLPLTKLTVVETSTSSPRGILSMQFNNGTDGARLGFAKARGTEATPLTVAANDVLGRLMFRGYDGSNFLEMGSIEVLATGTVASTRVPTAMVFSTATDAAPSVLTERMRIDNQGRVGIGTNAPAYLLDIGAGGDNNISKVVRVNAGRTGQAVLWFAQNSIRKVEFGVSEGAGGIITDSVSGDFGIRAFGGNILFSGDSGTTAQLYIKNTGNVGIGLTSPTAVLHLKAGTATANTAPLKFTSGTLLTTSEAGAVEFLTDNYYLTITSGAARKGIVLNDGTSLVSGRIPIVTTNGRLTDSTNLTFATDTLTSAKIKTTTPLGYAEMYMYENTTACVIDLQNTYHAIYNSFGNNDGILAPQLDTSYFTYKAGIGYAIASAATYNAGTQTQFTVTAGHALLAGEPITITGTPAYDGAYIVQAAGLTATQFVVNKAYTADQTGSVRRPATLKCLVAGVYSAQFTISGHCENANDVFKFELNKDVTALDNICANAIWSTASNYRTISGGGMTSLTANQYLWISVKNNTGAGDVTLRNANVNIRRMI